MRASGMTSQGEIFLKWPRGQAINVGNLLIFRMEAELLAQKENKKSAKIVFSKEDVLPPFTKEILQSGKIQIIDSREEKGESDWPPKDPIFQKWLYGSFKRVEYLVGKFDKLPVLSWKQSILDIALSLYKKSPRPVFAVHLKNQKKAPEESNASLKDWHRFFSAFQNMHFFLLGEDPISTEILSLQNVTKINQKDYPLSVQLALCSLCDGFIGMSSGLANAAILSATPYAIFKHPFHHMDEMKEEFGDRDFFSFAQPQQKVYRKEDSYENLVAAMELLT